MLSKLITAIILVTVCALGSAAQQTVTIDDTTDDSQVAVVGDMSNNSQTELQVGDTLVVKLSNNSGTGYQWYLERNNYSLLRLDNSRTQNSGGLLGGKNQQIFYFVAVAPGSDALSFAQRRIVGRESYTAEYFRTQVTINRGRQAKTVTLNEDNDRGSIRIRQGDTLVVKLKNNAGTGFRWSIDQNNHDLLRPTGKQGMITKLTNLLGGPANQTFTFSTPNSGKVKLRLLLQDSGSRGRVHTADQFEIFVQIDRT